jgi:hypothetical protein
MMSVPVLGVLPDLPFRREDAGGGGSGIVEDGTGTVGVGTGARAEEDGAPFVVAPVIGRRRFCASLGDRLGARSAGVGEPGAAGDAGVGCRDGAVGQAGVGEALGTAVPTGLPAGAGV